MSKAILEVVFDIEADEVILSEVKTLLTETDSPLTQSLISLVQARLSEIEGLEEPDIIIPPERINMRTSLDGGLNAQEWMDHGDAIDPSIKDQITEQGFQD